MAGPHQYTVFNGALPTTSSFVAVTTGSGGTPKTMLQVATSSSKGLKVVSWGVSFTGTSFGTKILCELLETDVAATVTTLSGHSVKTTAPADEATLVTFGTSATGYTASAEGSITATRLMDVQEVDSSGAYSYTWSLGNEPRMAVSKFLRVRVNSTVAVNCVTWITWEE